MLYLIDGAIVPQEGLYTFRSLNEAEFILALQVARKDDELRCHVPDPAACDMLTELTGVLILPPKDTDSAKVEMNDGDRLIVIQLLPMTGGDATNGGTPTTTISVRTTLMTHYNDNPEGIQAFLRAKASRADDQQSKDAYDNTATTLEYGFKENEVS